MSVCGITPVNNKIVGGQDTPAGSWPWQASLQESGSHVCGGSLVNKEWVIVRYREHKALSLVDRTSRAIVLHPAYDGSTHDNDIALLRLSSPVNFTDYIFPICLAASDSVFHKGTESWVTGWGNANEGDPLPPPQTLQEVEVPVVGNTQCDCLNGVGSITDNMLCAGALEGGKDSCQGDSGGPMVVKHNSVWVQSGVVSWGYGCARPNLPGVYTRVSSYQSWINSQISTDQPGFVEFTSSGVDADSSYICPTVDPTDTDSIFDNGQGLFGSLYMLSALFILVFLTI
uniref:Peptidase S1 domain-containing protein n=1 Tax=Hucho hucho TaxID=62062 RepID=A0A4W5MGA0_9TELE